MYFIVILYTRARARGRGKCEIDRERQRQRVGEREFTGGREGGTERETMRLRTIGSHVRNAVCTKLGGVWRQKGVTRRPFKGDHCANYTGA